MKTSESNQSETIFLISKIEKSVDIFLIIYFTKGLMQIKILTNIDKYDITSD